MELTPQEIVDMDASNRALMVRAREILKKI
jgi:hypothetical protein